MPGYLIDTDVVSKRNAANGVNIRRWLAGVDDGDLRISTITIFEISRGIQKKRDAGEAALATTLAQALDTLRAAFAGRILDVDAVVAEVWGRLAGPDRKQWMDRGLVATAKTHGLVLVSCNSNDTKGRGVAVVNPDRNKFGHWNAAGEEVPDGTVL